MGELRATARWVGGYRTELGDGRGHSVLVDLPKDEAGDDLGTSALELAVLSLAGCISTIFALVARRRRIVVRSVDVDLTADRPRGSPTVTKVRGTVTVDADSAATDVETAVAITVRTCPVGVLFERAGIPVEVRTVVANAGDIPGAEGSRTSVGARASVPS